MMPTLFVMAVMMAATGQMLEPGDHERKLTVDDRERNYLVHVPKLDLPAAGWPVVLIYHGGGTNAQVMVRFCSLNEKADSAGFVAVYPNGVGRLAKVLTFNGGNCCGYAMTQAVDDVKFTAAVLDDLERVLTVDKQRVFATGMSNGAIMSYLLASKMANRIAAIAPVGGPMGTETCQPSRPVPVCHFHGEDDGYAPYKGGRGSRSLTGTNFYSVEHSIQAWVKANGSVETPAVEELPVKVDDGTRVTKTVYNAGAGEGSAEVVLYTIHGGGHTWPGGDSRVNWLGKTTQNISANDIMWEFFQRHPRR